MVIAPFRAFLQSLTSEEVRNATRTAADGFPRISRGFSVAQERVGQNSAPALYSYDHRSSGCRICGVIALIEPEGAYFRSPMAAHPDAVAFARQQFGSKRQQFAPVLALYDAEPLPRLEAAFQQARANGDQLRICPVADPQVLSELSSALNDLPLTVMAGQEWLEVANGHPVMVLLINQRTCTAELHALHRTVRWKPGWHAGDMVRLGREHFFFHDISRFMPQVDGTGPHYLGPTAAEHLLPKIPGENVYIAVTARHTFRIHSLPGWSDTVLAHRSPEERSISALQLHEILIPDALELRPETANAQISYTGNMDEAVTRVIRGDADVAFLMNAPSVQQIVAVAHTGGSIPPHSFRLRLEPVPGAITYAF